MERGQGHCELINLIVNEFLIWARGDGTGEKGAPILTPTGCIIRNLTPKKMNESGGVPPTEPIPPDQTSTVIKSL